MSDDELEQTIVFIEKFTEQLDYQASQAEEGPVSNTLDVLAHVGAALADTLREIQNEASAD